MSEGKQQGQQEQQKEQQQSPTQRLETSLAAIRKVQNFLEMNQPGQTQAIKLLRQAGDLTWEELQEKQQRIEEQQK